MSDNGDEDIHSDCLSHQNAGQTPSSQVEP
jgi:hypothetical protein